MWLFVAKKVNAGTNTGNKRVFCSLNLLQLLWAQPVHFLSQKLVLLLSFFQKAVHAYGWGSHFSLLPKIEENS